jgi:hypothetical protein
MRWRAGDDLEGRIGHHRRAARPEECRRCQTEKIARSDAEENLIGAHAMEMREIVDQSLFLRIGITMGETQRLAHRAHGRWRRTVRILVRIQLHFRHGRRGTNDRRNGGQQCTCAEENGRNARRETA